MNNEKILAHVRMFVLREKLLCPGEPLHLAAAVSGGADSMALLRILLALQPEFGFVLSACHVNHGLRGESADRTKPLCGRNAPGWVCRCGCSMLQRWPTKWACRRNMPGRTGRAACAMPALRVVRGGDRCRCNGPYCK